MFTDMFVLMGLLGASLISYYIWQKHKDKSELQRLLLYGVGVIMIGWEYFAKNVLHLSGQLALINKYFILGFWIAALVFFVIITVKPKAEKDVRAE